MAYAIIRTGGKQYRVEPGDVIWVEALDGEVGSEITFPEVLLRSDGEQVTIGTPLVEGASVAARIIGQEKTRKILVFKKKRRKNYRRRHGHRQLTTGVQVLSI
ncbi:MAG TPA: 50S ribosomal protein L21 [Candidatus Binatia bacterium]